MPTRSSFDVIHSSKSFQFCVNFSIPEPLCGYCFTWVASNFRLLIYSQKSCVSSFAKRVLKMWMFRVKILYNFFLRIFLSNLEIKFCWMKFSLRCVREFLHRVRRYHGVASWIFIFVNKRIFEIWCPLHSFLFCNDFVDIRLINILLYPCWAASLRLILFCLVEQVDHFSLLAFLCFFFFFT